MVRFKHRYLLVHLIFPQTLPNSLDSVDPQLTQADNLPRPPHLSESGLISLLRESLSANFGDVGAGEVGGAFSSKLNLPKPSTHRPVGAQSDFRLS